MLADEGVRFTVFAPTDAAFEALFELLGTTLDELLTMPDLLKDILLYHVVKGVRTTADLAELEGVTTLQGGDIAISVDADDNVVLEDVAAIVTADVEAANGIIHIIDTVLMPPVEGATSAEPEPCLVSTTASDTVRIRVGPGVNRTSVSFLAANQEFEPLGQAEDNEGNLWFQLDKEQAAPGRAINEAWVAASELDTTGDCSAVGEAAAPPIIPIVNQPPPPADNTGGSGGDTDTGGGEQPPTDTSTLPASGTYTMTLAGTAHVSCEGTNSIPFPTADLELPASMRVSVRSAAESISLDGDAIAYAGPGYYTGQFTVDAGDVVTIQIFTGNSSSFSGRINYSFRASGRG
jgi:Fasciclin domain